jgi:group I intron endonuclease
MDRAAYVYRITNTVNNKQYIGVSVDVEKRFKSHCRDTGGKNLLLKNAILKYGKDAFKVETLLKATQKYCYEIEPKFIEAFGTLSPSGYNYTRGGMGSLGLTGEKNGCYGRTGEKHPNFGKPGYRAGVPHTEETKRKMRESRKNRKWPEEVKEKMRQAALNASPEINEKRRLARIAAFQKKKEGFK